MRPAKKLKERSILQVFISLLKDFPKSRIIASEAPDFIIKPSPKKQIGIELSHILHNDNGFVLHDFTYHLNQIVHHQLKDPSSGHIQFKKSIKEKDSETLANILIKLSQCSDTESLVSIIIRNPLVKKIITPSFDPDFTIGWSICRNNQSKFDAYSMLENAILEKNKKLFAYKKKKLNEYWLLLHIDCKSCFGNFNMDNFIERFQIESKFTKIFLLDLFNRRIYSIHNQVLY